VKTIVGLLAVAALVGLASSAAAQRLPRGSYRQSCWDIRMGIGPHSRVPQSPWSRYATNCPEHRELQR